MKMNGEKEVKMNNGKQPTRSFGLTKSDASFFQCNRWRLIGVGVVLLIISLIGWQLYDRRYPSWDEEVQLSDGRVITIHQEHEYYADYGTNQSWVTIDLPELGGKRVWHSYLMPQRLDVYEGKVYVFGAPRGIRQFQFYRYPKHYLVAFKWSGSDFVRIPFLEVPESLRRLENVYPCVPNPKAAHLLLVEKNRNWCPERGDKWKFNKQILLTDYEQLSIFYADLDGGKPLTD